MKLSGGKKSWMMQNSRNVLSSGKSTTSISFSRSVSKSTTPLKIMNIQKSARADVNTREKALLQQNVELRKQNNELVHLLKKSKELIKAEIEKYKAENMIMKKFAEVAWNWAEPNLEDKLKDEVKTLLMKPNTKVNSIATNSTDHCSGEGETGLIKHKLSNIRKLNDTKLENEKLNRYLCFLEEGHKNMDSESECKWKANAIPIPNFIKSLNLA